MAAIPQASNDQVGALDRGIKVTVALPDGTHFAMPAFFKIARQAITGLQRKRATYEVGSPEWKKLNRKIAKIYAKAHHQSEDWASHVAKDIVTRYGVIALEDLKLINMTKSAKGNSRIPGRE